MAILKIILKRVGLGFLSLLFISLLVFLGVEALPGDLAEAILGKDAIPETVAAFRAALNLDAPPHVRYLSWLAGFLRGDLGISLATESSISDVIGWRLYNTFVLASLTALFAVPLSVGLGLYAALKRNSLIDRTLNVVSLTAISFPEFFIAYILIALFSVYFIVFPAVSTISASVSGWEWFLKLVLPSLTLLMVISAHMMRMTRAAVINILSNSYIEMALLKGIRRKRIILHHALPNALSPIINVVILNLAYLVVGVVVVEVVFVYPGLGQLMVDAVSMRDLPVVQACAMIFAAVYVTLNLLADILSILANPKLRHPK
jgi:peptide/nickel transport system permease protein